jgi:hypothetical protein
VGPAIGVGSKHPNAGQTMWLEPAADFGTAVFLSTRLSPVLSGPLKLSGSLTAFVCSKKLGGVLQILGQTGRLAPSRARLLGSRYQNPGFPSSDTVICGSVGLQSERPWRPQVCGNIGENFGVPRSASSPPGVVRILGKVAHQFNECRRLTDEQAHGR